MNEEERKAIEDITREITDEDRKEYMNKWFLDDLTILIKLIEKQQKEIEKLRNNNKDLLRKLRNRVKEVKKLEKYSLYKKEFATLNKQLAKKDEVIDFLERRITALEEKDKNYAGFMAP